MAQITVEGPDGQPLVPKANEDGALIVAGADGGGVASEDTLAAIKEDTEALAGTITSGQPAGNDPKIAVGIASSVTLTVEVGGGQTASATPEPTAEGVVVRHAGPVSLGVDIVPAGEVQALSTFVQGGTVDAAISNAPDRPIFAQGSNDLGEAERLATKAGQDGIETALGPKATTADVQEVRDAVDELEPDADATRVAVESIDDKTPLGPANMVGSRPIVFAIDHPPVPAELYVGLAPLSNTNPVFVRGIIPSRTATGTPVAASSGQVGSNGAGALLYFRGHVESPAGARYVLLFDATSGDALATAKLIPNVAFPVTVTLSRFEQRFGYPLSFASGLRWAVSSTEHTYTASADTAFVFAQWIQL